MSKKDNVIIPTAFTDVNHADPGTLPTNRQISDNDGTGGGNMNDKYVTHEELELSNEKLLHHIDNKFAEMQQQMNHRFNEVDKRFNDVDKHFNELELKVNDVKNTANNNKEKTNWLLYTAFGGIIISVITTIISNLLTK